MDLSSPRNDAKRLKACSYLFSKYSIFTVPGIQIKREGDIEKNGYVFTDGCGEMSNEAAQKIFSEFRNTDKSGDLKGIPDDYIPSVIQVRLPGVKGVFLLNPNLEGCVIILRDSMIKLDVLKLVKDSNLPIAILGHSKSAGSFHQLNSQAVSLLLLRGVDPLMMRRRAKMYVDAVRYCFYL